MQGMNDISKTNDFATYFSCSNESAPGSCESHVQVRTERLMSSKKAFLPGQASLATGNKVS